MSFLRFFLMSWVASKAMEGLEQKVSQTLREKQEEFANRRTTSGQTAGSSDGSKDRNADSSKEKGESKRQDDRDRTSERSANRSENSSRSQSDSGALTEFNAVEIGFVFALSQELVGVLDQMKSTKITKGNGLKYYSGIWNGRSVVLVECGVGQKNAAEATKALIQIFRPRRIVSAGFAGALVPSLTRFQVVVPNLLVRESDGETIDLWGNLLADSRSENGDDSVDQNESKRSSEKGGKRNSYFATGTLLTSDRVVSTSNEKRSLGQKFAASLVDMETWSVAEICRNRGVPFLPLRVVLDSVDQELSPEIKNITNSVQNPARLTGALFGAMFKKPSSVLEMFQLKGNALTAADKIAEAVAKIVSLR